MAEKKKTEKVLEENAIQDENVEVETLEEVVDSEEKEVKESKKGILKKKNDSELQKLVEENKVLQDKVLRVTAEMQNMKRRMEEERSNLLKYEGEDFIKSILPIADNFERAIGVNEEGLSEEVVKYLNGFKMIYSNLSSILQSNQVEIIDAINKPFDPNTMDAVMTEENSEVEPNTVIDVLQKGYTYKGKVIRHAMVKVSK